MEGLKSNQHLTNHINECQNFILFIDYICFQCLVDGCGKLMKRNKNRDLMLCHNIGAQEPFKCEQCDYVSVFSCGMINLKAVILSFFYFVFVQETRSKGSLDRHWLVHTKQHKTIKCPMCNRSIKRDRMMRHVKSVHKIKLVRGHVTFKLCGNCLSRKG